MRKFLVKREKTSNKFLEIEVENHLLRQKEGRVGLNSTKRTTHCGNHEKALKAAHELLLKFKNDGYVEETVPENIITPSIFDNAEWHYGGDFPIVMIAGVIELRSI